MFLDKQYKGNNQLLSGYYITEWYVSSREGQLCCDIPSQLYIPSQLAMLLYTYCPQITLTELATKH